MIYKDIICLKIIKLIYNNSIYINFFNIKIIKSHYFK